MCVCIHARSPLYPPPFSLYRRVLCSTSSALGLTLYGVCVAMHACMHVCMCVRMCIYMHACMHACMHVCMCVCIHACSPFHPAGLTLGESAIVHAYIHTYAGLTPLPVLFVQAGAVQYLLGALFPSDGRPASVQALENARRLYAEV